MHSRQYLLNMNEAAIPLCVDLDGTLVRSDTLFESFLKLVKQSPWSMLWIPFWLLLGRAVLKHRIAERVEVDVAYLPYHQELLDWLKQQAQSGRRLILCTAADRKIAEAVAGHVGIFEQVLASEGAANLKGEGKRRCLVESFGERGFDYAGNDRSDWLVWASARKAIVVNASESVRLGVPKTTIVETHFAGLKSNWKTWVKALRLHQWVKNVLVFLPALLAHQLSGATLTQSILAFLAFSLCASSVYLVNDLLDLDSDRRHVRKRQRPFASGALKLSHGLALSPILLLVAFAIALLLPVGFIVVLAGYYTVTLAYSLYLKRVATMDVMLLAMLYTLRIIAGGAATGIALSFWLLAFSMFVFLSLGIVKRYAELDGIKAAGGKAVGRGYQADDLPIIRNLGVSSGYCAVLVLSLYINSPESQYVYTHPYWLWLLCPLMLYWVSRVWMLTHRGEMDDDPIVFALKDKASLLIVAIMATCVYLAA